MSTAIEWNGMDLVIAMAEAKPAKEGKMLKCPSMIVATDGLPVGRGKRMPIQSKG